MDRQQAEVLEGTVEDIVFHNEDTGFTVMEVAAGEALITVVGEAMGIQPGEELRLTGRYVSHPTYGTQFKAAVIERTIPATSGAILKYLSGGAIRGIGPALARRIVDAFGDDTLTIMEKEPQRLAEVRGITPKKAAEIAETAGAEDVIIAAATVVAIDGLVLGKPRDRAEAAEMLSRIIFKSRADTP